MRRILKTGSLMYAFDSMQDMNEFSDPTKARTWLKGSMRFIHGSFKDSEEEMTDWDDLQKRCKIVWKEGIKVLEDNLTSLEKTNIPELKSMKRHVEWSWDTGDEYDLERMLQGLPPWKKYVREESSGPTTVTVFIDTTTSYAIDAKDILWRGAAAIALTKILEEKGYRVEVWVVNGSKLFMGEPTRVMTACCLKRCSDPLDTSTLINAAAGWFYRTATFTVLSTIGYKEHKTVESNLGTVMTPRQSDLDDLSEDTNRIYSSGCFDKASAISMIVGEIEKLSESSMKKEHNN